MPLPVLVLLEPLVDGAVDGLLRVRVLLALLLAFLGALLLQSCDSLRQVLGLLHDVVHPARVAADCLEQCGLHGPQGVYEPVVQGFRDEHGLLLGEGVRTRWRLLRQRGGRGRLSGSAWFGRWRRRRGRRSLRVCRRLALGLLLEVNPLA